MKKRRSTQKPAMVLFAAATLALSCGVKVLAEDAAAPAASDNKTATAVPAQESSTADGATDQKTTVPTKQPSAFDLIRKPTQQELDAIDAMQKIRENDAKKADEAARKAEETKANAAKKTEQSKSKTTKASKRAKQKEAPRANTAKKEEPKPPAEGATKPQESKDASATGSYGDDATYRDLLKSGEAAYRQKDYEGADKALTQALEEAEKFGKEDKRVAPVLDYKALVASMKRDYKGAIECQKRAQDINTGVYGANSKQVAYDLQHLSLWYEANKQNADADAAFKQSVEVMEKAVGKDDPALADSLCKLAAYDLKHQRVADSCLIYRRALDIYAKAGKDGAAMETSLKLRELLMQQNKWAEVDKLCQDEIERETKDLGPDSATLSVTLSSVADMYMSKGHYAQAEPLLRRAVSIQRTTMGEDHPITAATSYSLAVALSKEGKYYDADPLFKLAIRVLAHTRQKDAVPGIMEDYADCLMHLGRKAEAANMRAQAKAMGH